MVKVQDDLQIQGIYLNIAHATYSKTTADIMLNGEKCKAFQLKLDALKI